MNNLQPLPMKDLRIHIVYCLLVMCVCDKPSGEFNELKVKRAKRALTGRMMRKMGGEARFRKTVCEK